MPALPSDLRRVLENAVVAARDEATGAAAAALKRLAVGVKEFPNYLTADERVLRQRLRAAARQLGDSWNADKQAFATLNKLTHEVAYEHWHRMLFARFLAENNLLIHPEHGVHVDLSTVAELAQEEATRADGGAKADTWAMAGRFAAAMLPQIFRLDDPALAVQLAPEHQQALERILESLPPSVFTADDSLGWVYQFWQSAEKDRVNAGVKGGDKITGETLPAVTQLFTEHYMVLFLLHNTVGAWWAGKQITRLPKVQMANWVSEADARAAVALPGYSFDYLRFVKDERTGAWRPASGTFEGWPKSAKEFTVLDPCCGSGHFLVAALELLSRLRMVEEGLSARDATAAVIADNLFGLELDARCTQIAAFNVALAVWKLNGEHFPIADMHIACSGLGPSATLDQWLKLADKNSKAWTGIPNHARQAVTNGLTNLHRLFSQAPELGSLIDPSQLGAGGELFSADWETLQPFLAAAMQAEKDEDAHERAIAAQGMTKAAALLSAKYTLVMTNVPFVGIRKQNDALLAYCARNHAAAKHDLSTCLIDRSMALMASGGTGTFVSPHNWLFLGAYKTFRTELVKGAKWHFVAQLGPGSFQTPMYDFGITLVAMSREPVTLDHSMAGIDVEQQAGPKAKAEHLTAAPVLFLSQLAQLKNPDQRVTLTEASDLPLLQEFATCQTGVLNGDSPKFIKHFWEFATRPADWAFLQSTVTSTTMYGGREQVIYFDEINGHLREAAHIRREHLHDSDQRGNAMWGKTGIMVHRMGDLPVTIYSGEVFDQNGAVTVPVVASAITALWSFLCSESFCREVRRIDNKVGVTPATLAKVPFDLAYWQKVAAEKYPNGLPEPQSDDPTQWIFYGHPAGRVPLSTDPNPHLATVLQVAVARVVGYRWPAELDEKMRLAPEARAWVEKCKELERFADDDGVVPLVPINKEQPGSERVRAVLEAAFGSRWSPGLLNDLLAAAGSPGKSLDEWAKHEFYAQHCSLFHQRPFVWQIWDGKKDGFNILVHYHRLVEGDGKGHKLLTKITYTYLGDWIAQQQAAAKRSEAGADTRLKAAQDLQKKLEAILAGEPPYDIFVRWKPLHEQPIGWNPDINDGVRVNIRPFVTAGVLRGKVNVKWTKDRGKEPESIRPKAQFPWFWSCPEDEPPTDFMGGDKFTGERLNDLHYTRKAKEAVRAVIGRTA